MARPKKQDNEQTEEVEQPTKKKIEMNNVALSVVKVDNKWQLVRIKFDIDTGAIGDVSLQEMEDLGYAVESVQIALEDEVFGPILRNA